MDATFYQRVLFVLLGKALCKKIFTFCIIQVANFNKSLQVVVSKLQVLCTRLERIPLQRSY
jgi:hypothetical protein